MTHSACARLATCSQGAVLDEKGPARALNRRALSPSAGLRKPTGPGFPPARAGRALPPPFRVRVLCFADLAGRSTNDRPLEVLWSARARRRFCGRPRRGGWAALPARPAALILLSITGWPKVERVFLTVDAIEASGIDPCDVAPDHWRHVHNRLAVAQAPRSYSPARHRAWLQRKALLP
jgi:Protein of unknown function (DUF2840)